MSFSYYETRSSFENLNDLRETFIRLALEEHMDVITFNSKFL